MDDQDIYDGHPHKEAYDLFAESLGLRRLGLSNIWLNNYDEKFVRTEYGFRRVYTSKNKFNDEDLCHYLQEFGTYLLNHAVIYDVDRFLTEVEVVEWMRKNIK